MRLKLHRYWFSSCFSFSQGNIWENIKKKHFPLFSDSIKYFHISFFENTIFNISSIKLFTCKILIKKTWKSLYDLHKVMNINYLFTVIKIKCVFLRADVRLIRNNFPFEMKIGKSTERLFLHKRAIFER